MSFSETHQSTHNSAFLFLFYLKAKSGMYLKWVEADKLLAQDEFNECNVPHGSPRSTPAACLHNQSLRAAHFLRRGR